MNRRKRTRQTAERDCASAANITKMSKTKQSTNTNTDAADEPKVEVHNETNNANENEVLTSPVDLINDDFTELNHNSTSTGDSTDEINAATDDLLREADILMAEIAEFRRDINNDNGQNNDDEAVIVNQNDESPEQAAESASTSSQTTSANVSQTNNTIDDSVVVIDDFTSDTVRPMVRDDDEDVIFVTETRQRQRTIATIDLCDTPDNSFICTRNVGPSIDQPPPAPANNSPNKPLGSHVGKTKCPICLEMFSMDEILSTMCGHLYCDPCIRSVIKTRKKCPMCNRALKQNQVHRIFLDS